MSKASGRLLDWAQKTCPSRVKDLADMLQCSCQIMEAQDAELRECLDATDRDEAAEAVVSMFQTLLALMRHVCKI